MTRLRSKLLIAFFAACGLASLVAWGVTSTTICDNPRTPVPETQHVIAYNCHGMTVYISPFQETLRTWLIPLFIAFGLLAGVAVLLASATIRVNVRIHVRNTSRKIPPR